MILTSLMGDLRASFGAMLAVAGATTALQALV
jgi:hypothetical protein